jgi:probable lipoprotein (TIGR04455 family)
LRALIFGLLVLTACSGTIKNVKLRADYDSADKTQTVRLAIVTAPLSEGGEKVAAMWSRIARRYTNHHRDFVAKVELTGEDALANACGEGIDGVLHLSPSIARDAEAVSCAVTARLFRCRDKEEVWRAEAGGSWPSADPQVSEVIAEYAEAFGEEVRPYAAPSFHLLRATLDELPRPVLSDEAVMEKIELGE